MTKTTYDAMPRLIRQRKPFEGNSVIAELSRDGDQYMIYSYNTLIARFDRTSARDKNREDFPLVFFDNKQYSSTTSRLQNIIIDVVGLRDNLDREVYQTGDLKVMTGRIV